jgi:hypothetical protein
MSKAEKFVLCRPQGGINDMLNQIEKCRLYAWRYGRTLLVDTNYENAIHFRDDFANYFVSKRKYMQFGRARDRIGADETSVSPGVLAGRLNDYPFRFDVDAMCYVESASRAPLTFDFSKDHTERVLVHHTGGGGVDSIAALRRMRLNQTLAKEVVRRRALLNDSYIAVHVRNTDYISNYKPIIADINDRDYRGQLLICTDDKNVVEEFRSGIRHADVVSLANLETGDDRRIHFLKPTDDSRSRNIDAICDLMLLALSNELFVAHLLPNEETPGGFSGFSLLAGLLHRDPTTLWNLLGPAAASLRKRTMRRTKGHRIRHLRALYEQFVDSYARG